MFVEKESIKKIEEKLQKISYDSELIKCDLEMERSLIIYWIKKQNEIIDCVNSLCDRIDDLNDKLK